MGFRVRGLGGLSVPLSGIYEGLGLLFSGGVL